MKKPSGAGAVDQARTHFRAAIDANPSSLSNYMSLELLSERQGNWEEAKKLCEKAHQIDPASPFIANNLAYLYLEHGGDLNVAYRRAWTARQKDPESPVPADTLGWAYYKLGSPQAAVTQLTDSVKKAPRNPAYQYQRGENRAFENILVRSQQISSTQRTGATRTSMYRSSFHERPATAVSGRQKSATVENKIPAPNTLGSIGFSSACSVLNDIGRCPRKRSATTPTFFS